MFIDFLSTGYAWGLFETDHKFPAYQENIYVFINPALDESDEKLYCRQHPFSDGK